MNRWSHDPRTGAFKDKHGAYVLERDHGHKVQALLDEIAGLQARNLCLEARPEFRYVAQDKPETWPARDMGRIVCWSVDDPSDIFISDGGIVDPRTVIAWMPVPIVPRT